ncbi:MAG: T9SS type A sorting domain-containing protein [Bacteroidetes bacterium]|nr:T9SS type A sorting domain-containing protein [Bacteroidota bacterium]MBL6964234.1 T9SS type A sorting domain-containing protein [Bacteroidota bacterium]
MKSATLKKIKIGFIRRIRKLILFQLLGISAIISVANAAHFTVSNVSEFQAALNTAATNGAHDTIQVMSGTYNVSATLTYWSNEEYTIHIMGAGSPVLNGNNSIQVMQLTNLSNTGDISIEGVIIQHGNADYGGGLGIETTSADVSLHKCTINDNVAVYVAAGVNIYSVTGNIQITNCTFRKNSSPNTSGYPYGTAGGLFIQTEGADTEMRIMDCLFENNTAERDAAGAMLYPVGENSTVIVEYNTFNDNTANEYGGGCWIRCPNTNATVKFKYNSLTNNSAAIAGSAGGTYIEIASGTIDLSGNMHSGNNAVWDGGGLWIEHGGGNLNIQNNSFTKNNSLQNGGAANVFLESGTATIDHNIFNDNDAMSVGGGLSMATTSGSMNIFNNTFNSNTADEGGDVYLYFDHSSSSANFYNNILYHSSFPALAFSGAQTVVAKYSDIRGGAGHPWFGTGCIDADPLFADSLSGDFHLSWSSFPVSDSTKSPCINSGDPSSPLDPDSSVADMGALYYGQKEGIKENRLKAFSNNFSLSQNYPNPFNLSTTIEYRLYRPTHVSLKIYNVSGQWIETIVNAYKLAGTHKVDWNAKEKPAGVYYSQMQAGGHSLIKKLILIK